MEVSVHLHAPAALALVPIEQEAVWASQPVWTFSRREKSLASAATRTLYLPACYSPVPVPTMLPELRNVPQSAVLSFVVG
jgi:hypothetical protein